MNQMLTIAPHPAGPPRRLPDLNMIRGTAVMACKQRNCSSVAASSGPMLSLHQAQQQMPVKAPTSCGSCLVRHVIANILHACCVD